MSLNPTKPTGSIAVNREPKYYSMTIDSLIQQVFVKTGSCATVSNVTTRVYGWNGSSWTSAARGLGYFHKSDSNFPIEEGLVMSTGDVRDTEGPNLQDRTMDGGSPFIGDADLQGLLPSGHSVTNVCVIEFDFVPTANTLQFQYIFASEEYPEYANSPYNDVFGFFVNQKLPSVSGKANIARLPTSNTGRYEVSISNVNNGAWSDNRYLYPHSSLSHTSKNASYFIPNVRGSLTTEMDGYTTVLTATYNVTPCNTYHMKLALGNAGDKEWGSAVFLKARSFDVGRDLVFSGNSIDGNEFIFKGCNNNYFDVTRTMNTNQAATIQMTYHNTGGAVNGTHYTDPSGNQVATNVSFAANETTKRVYLKATDAAVPGSYFDISMQCPCAGSQVAVVKRIYIYDFVTSVNGGATSACSSGNNGKITASGTGGSGNYEYKLGSGAWQSSNVFTGLPPGTYTVYIRDFGTCAPPLSTVVTIGNLTASAGPDQSSCSGNTFTMAGNQPGIDETGSWTRVSGGNVSIASPTAYNTAVTLTSGTSAVLRWTLNNGVCSSSDDVVISQGTPPTPPTVTAGVSYCRGASASPLAVTPVSGYTLRWYDAADIYQGTTAPTPSTASAGTTIYKVSRVQTSSGCESAKATITVTVTPPPTATVSGPATICEEMTQISLTFTLAGSSPWTINYTEHDLATDAKVPKSTVATSPVHLVTANPFNSSEYILTQVSDAGGCISTVRDSVKVQFQPCGFKAPMLLWLKANDGPYLFPDSVVWRDRSQAFNIKTEAQKSAPYTNIQLQSAALNFNPAFVFNGSTGQYLSGTTLNPEGFTFKSTLFTVSVRKPASTITNFPQGVFSTSDGNTPIAPGQEMLLSRPASTPFYLLGGANTTGTHSPSNSGSSKINLPLILRGQYPDSISTQGAQFWENGTLLATKNTSPYNSHPPITPNFDVGGRSSSPGYVFDGKIAEIIYFYQELDATEGNKVDSYLAIKYGISMEAKNYLASDGTTVIWKHIDNLTFATHIAGIGRDNGYALDQRISHNTSPGDLVSVAHNPAAFVSNQSLAPSIATDKSYLIWSSNNEAKSYGPPQTLSGHNLRLLNRKWRVRKTGTVGNVSMQFDTAGIGIPPGWGGTPALIVSSAFNFGGGLAFYQAQAGYPQPTYHNVNLTEGYHFTLVLTEGVNADAGPDQTVCSVDPLYEFTMAANPPGVDQAGKWEIVTQPSPGSVTVLNPNLNTTKVRLATTGTSRLRWIIWNTYSMDADTSYVDISRLAPPVAPPAFAMPVVCPGNAGNDSIRINPSNPGYLYTVYDQLAGGSVLASANGTGGKLVITPGSTLTSEVYYYIEIKDVATSCVSPVRWQVHIPVYASAGHPDIRLQVCNNPGYTLDLHTLINTADYLSSTFHYATNPSLITGGHLINVASLSSGTHVIDYTVTGHCGSKSAKIYLKTLNSDQAFPVPTTLYVCAHINPARHVQLQQAFGLDVSGGAWGFDASLTPLADYITNVNGAYVFNAQKAWLDGKGTASGSNRHFNFNYYINGSNCFPNSVHTLTIVVTEEM